ncbi:MAG: hypothetical protein BRD44_01825 [Bacteroidetes bacterium QS_7_67_15]|nr:MAG: hypothetical protein BRD44_01825 [Bacteroidetes bacterium QS_7_67_15]
MRPPAMRRFLFVLSSFLLAGLLTLTACADDPILGPQDGDDSGGGGSYGNLNRLTPPASDSAAADSSRPNPHRF